MKYKTGIGLIFTIMLIFSALHFNVNTNENIDKNECFLSAQARGYDVNCWTQLADIEGNRFVDCLSCDWMDGKALGVHGTCYNNGGAHHDRPM